MLYPVPLNIRSVDGGLHQILFAEREATIKVQGFVKLNADHTGIYRTSYSAEYLEKLAQDQAGILSVEDRAGMIADAAVLASSGHQKTSDFLKLLTKFTHESQYIVWDIIVTHLNAIQSAWMFEEQRTQDGLRDFVRRLVGTKASELGWNLVGSDHIDKNLKTLLFGAAGGAGDAPTVEAARKMFLEFASNRSAIDANLRPHVFRMALENGGVDEVNKRLLPQSCL